MIGITMENPDQAEVAALLEASDAYMASLYPAESNHMLDIASLQRPEVVFLVARVDGRALGCGAVVSSGQGWAEIKRMFVSPAARGMKLGRRLLDEIEAIAVRNAARVLRLETGAKQPEALALTARPASWKSGRSATIGRTRSACSWKSRSRRAGSSPV